jgi:hypothetical protein
LLVLRLEPAFEVLDRRILEDDAHGEIHERQNGQDDPAPYGQPSILLDRKSVV